jgi:hypothetical protein
MMQVIIHDIGKKQIDFGVITNSTDYPKECVFLTQGPRSPGDFCLYDPYNFLTHEERIQLLYKLSLEMMNLKNSS